MNEQNKTPEPNRLTTPEEITRYVVSKYREGIITGLQHALNIIEAELKFQENSNEHFINKTAEELLSKNVSTNEQPEPKDNTSDSAQSGDSRSK